MKKNLIKRYIKGLKKAKKDIISGECFGVCSAIRHQASIYGNKNPVLLQEDFHYLRVWVSDMLGKKNVWLESWLESKGIPVPDKEGMIKLRCDWIDWMIGELKNESNRIG